MSMRSSAAGPPTGAGRPPQSPAATTDPAAVPARGVAPAGYRYLNDPKFPALAAYVNRTTFVLAQGRPGAQIGVYIPSSSFWFGDRAPNTTFLAIVHSLLGHQRDLDFVDEYALSTSLQLRGSQLVNRSGQGYRAIVIPPAVAISQAALDHLQAFAAAGGKVIFIGGAPRLVVGPNFLTADPARDLSWATVEPASEVTAQVLAALPDPEVALDQAAPGLKYIHRRLRDGEAYFFFNEGDAALTLNAAVTVGGTPRQAQTWDGHSGQITALAGATLSPGRAILPLSLESWATALVVISSSPAGVTSLP
jgi:hypothetical protein